MPGCICSGAWRIGSGRQTSWVGDLPGQGTAAWPWSEPQVLSGPPRLAGLHQVGDWEGDDAGDVGHRSLVRPDSAGHGKAFLDGLVACSIAFFSRLLLAHGTLQPRRGRCIAEIDPDTWRLPTLAPSRAMNAKTSPNVSVTPFRHHVHIGRRPASARGDRQRKGCGVRSRARSADALDATCARQYHLNGNCRFHR